ncbi:ethanolamine utilization protein EutN-like protein [Rhodopirellula islandica]|uniref:Ethanolamine utilization protein EutN-like protein n=1 Tax=Rhodopirellula islandica TaxID=595434 RepID=A0A0J1EBF6_RHOIS|nr:EutN/CcmL family microcompartment protein [Rhodopirellula islandica]KLU02884.1 ethanolamine utilization protein EutN-like protein [Rhodopirellula islandica]
MQPARVIGHTRATVKHESLQGQRLVLVQPTGVDEKPDGPPLLVLDELGCRVGDRVMLTSETGPIREMTGSDTCPARWSVQGLIDEPTKKKKTKKK